MDNHHAHWGDSDGPLHAPRERRQHFDDDEPTRSRKRPRRRARRPADDSRPSAREGRQHDPHLADELAAYRLYGEVLTREELNEILGQEWVTYNDDNYDGEDEGWPYD